MRKHETSINGEAAVYHEGHGGMHTADYVPNMGRVILRHWYEGGEPCECDGGDGVADASAGDYVWHRADTADDTDAAAEWCFQWAAANPCIDGTRYGDSA